MKHIAPIFLLFAASPSFADGLENIPHPIEAEVVRVIDGDTVEVDA